MIELYFLLYRVPKMMTALARERNRSALAWSLIGMASWIGTELVVLFGFGIIYGMGMIFLGWPKNIPPLIRILVYIAAIAAAIGGFTLARRILIAKPRKDYFPEPPPPPQF